MESKPSLAELESKIRDQSLDAGPEVVRQAGYRVVDWIVNRLASIRESDLGRELPREETEKLLRERMPEEPSDFLSVFEEYTRKVAPNTIHLDHPRFFAFVPSAPNYASILAEALVAGANVFAGTWLDSSGPSQVELVVLDWFKEMLGLPERAAGLLVSGGSVANLTALAAARHAVLSDETAGAIVYLSEQTHASVERALRILAIPPRQVRHVPTDSRYRLKVAELKEQIQSDRRAGLRPFAVVANAGTTNTGAIDPMEEIAAVAREHGVWLHVDAAYGGFAALTPRGRRLLEGIEQADSVVLDPHKWFYCPFEAGCVLVREVRLLRETFRILPEYMYDVAREEQEVNFCDYGIQLTRSFRALKVWMSVKTHGARRLREVIDQCMDLAEYAAGLCQESPHLEIVTPPSLGIFTFRYLPRQPLLPGFEFEESVNRLNKNLAARIIASRQLMLSSTRLEGRVVLRFCLLNHRTRKEDIREAQRLILQLGQEAEEQLRRGA